MVMMITRARQEVSVDRYSVAPIGDAPSESDTKQGHKGHHQMYHRPGLAGGPGPLDQAAQAGTAAAGALQPLQATGSAPQSAADIATQALGARVQP